MWEEGRASLSQQPHRRHLPPRTTTVRAGRWRGTSPTTFTASTTGFKATVLKGYYRQLHRKGRLSIEPILQRPWHAFATRIYRSSAISVAIPLIDKLFATYLSDSARPRS